MKKMRRNKTKARGKNDKKMQILKNEKKTKIRGEKRKKNQQNGKNMEKKHANCKSSRQVTKISFLGSMDKNVHPAGVL